MSGCPGVGPCCVYDLDLSCCLAPSGILPDPCLLSGQPVSQVIIDNAKLAASQLMWSLTGRQFSVCQVTVRPCRRCQDACCLPFDGFWSTGSSGFPWTPTLLPSGQWTNVSCNCQDQCSCINLSEVNLPNPVCSIQEVKIDGVVVDPTTYRVDNFRKLVRLGSDVWPKCNDLTKPDTEVGTWSVKLQYGIAPPQLVLLAAAEMACEIIKGCVGQPCRLPQRVTSVTRQGISVSFLDDMAFLDKGLTGMYFVDLAARTYNPGRLYRKPIIASPDSINQWRVETWHAGDPDPSCT
jgi:hypothetical protein